MMKINKGVLYRFREDLGERLFFYGSVPAKNAKVKNDLSKVKNSILVCRDNFFYNQIK